MPEVIILKKIKDYEYDGAIIDGTDESYDIYSNVARKAKDIQEKIEKDQNYDANKLNLIELDIGGNKILFSKKSHHNLIGLEFSEFIKYRTANPQKTDWSKVITYIPGKIEELPAIEEVELVTKHSELASKQLFICIGVNHRYLVDEETDFDKIKRQCVSCKKLLPKNNSFGDSYNHP